MSNIDKPREMTDPTQKSDALRACIVHNRAQISAEAKQFRDAGVHWAHYVVTMHYGFSVADDDNVATLTVDIRAVHDGSTGLAFPLDRAAAGPDPTRANGLTRVPPDDDEIRVLVSHSLGESLFFVKD